MIEKYFISPGIQWVEIKEAGLRILCGSPMDAIKHLKARGFLKPSEIKGHYFEYGPNAILLSDLSTQNGSFCNLSEFPVLHMIYKQGMGLTGHPNSQKGYRPLIMGTMEQVLAQQNYIFRGNTGLCNREEMIQAGFSGEELEQHWQLKLFFNGGDMSGTNELIDGLIIGRKEKEIRNGVRIKRQDMNLYEISYKNDSVMIDLNLKANETYGTTFDLGFHKINREYFSVIHTGEGNGWDASRSCMGSMVTFQDKIFLIDAGPHIDKILTSLGICNSQIDGIIQTHAHDDHFAGLTTLFQTGKKINYYATKPVRHTVQKKFSALTGTNEDAFGSFFEIHDLKQDVWNDIHGLDVKPLYSPHPLETTILYFRAYGEFGEAVYGHLADIIGKNVLKKAVKGDDEKGISPEFFNHIWEGYELPCDLKKIDGGMGFVHGNANDFKNDSSKKLLISHTDWELTVKEREIGNNAAFGQQDVLIPARVDYTELFARKLLEHYFPQSPSQDRELLLNSHRITSPPGTILIPRGKKSEHVYLILTGFAEYINSRENITSFRSVGSILGDMSVLQDKVLEGTYRTSCYVTSLKIPARLFCSFVNRSHMADKILAIQERKQFILNNSHIGSVLPYMQLNKLVEALCPIDINDELTLDEEEEKIYILHEGQLDLYYNERLVKRLKPGDPFSLPSVLTLLAKEDRIVNIKVKCLDEKARCFVLPEQYVRDVPVLQWRYLELFRARLKKSREE